MTTIVIPTLGGRQLAHCLEAVGLLDPAPRSTVVVVSGAARPVVPDGVRLVTRDDRLGFAAAVNAGIRSAEGIDETIAVLNDDAVPEPGWLGVLERALDDDPTLSSVQGTVTDAVGAAVDGRGISFDSTGLPVQIDAGGSPAPEPKEPFFVIGVSGTASLFRLEALTDAALADGSVFDPAFGSYHEDLDLGLRLRRLGWQAAWVPGAFAHHIGSATGHRLGWRHPWWLLANRWRALAGNLTFGALICSLPRLLRGEVRAIHTLARRNVRTIPTAVALFLALPWIVTRSFARPSPGPRLTEIPEVGS